MTLRICGDRNMLVECLKEREAEVMSIMEALFDQEEVTRRYGIALEKAKAEEIARNLKSQGKLTEDDIAECTGLSPDEVRNLQYLQTV